MINVILAEDHYIVREGISSLLEKQAHFTITGKSQSGQDVLELLENGTQADVILADINMPIMGGLELTEIIHKRFPKVKVIILSVLDNEKYVVNAFQRGASGYLLKGASTEELTFAIQHVYQHGSYVSSTFMTGFLNRAINIPESKMSEDIKYYDFSDRDVEILRLISLGYTNNEISDKLFISKRTIENQRQALIDRTSSRNTVSLIRFALLNGLIN